MDDREPVPEGFRFGAYELSLRTKELRKEGVRIKLQEKPFQVLCLLAEKAGETVPREDFRRRLWPADTYVDFDANLNTALAKVRQALEESAENPRFVETVPRLGYRFIAPIESWEAADAAPRQNGSRTAPLAQGSAAPIPVVRRSWKGNAARTALLIAVVSLLSAYLARFVPFSLPRVPAGKPVLVVLPFVNLSREPAQDYFSDGLTDELITQIGSLNPQRLGVIARTSAMHYKGTQATVEQIARELGVDYVLEGSVRRSGGEVHITAQLVQARDQTRLWAHSYESTSADLIQVQDDVARNVASALAVELLPASRVAAGQAAIRNPEAYETYLEGRLYWNQRSKDGLKKAAELFYQALQEDPQSAPAYAGLADTFLAQADWLMARPGEAYPKARQAAQKALELDNSLGSAHAVLANVSWEYDKDWAHAEGEFQRALALDPANARTRQSHAEYLCSLGHHEEAMAEMMRAHQRDPLSLSISADIGNLLYLARRYDAAIAQIKTVLESDPNFIPARVYFGRALVASGRYSEALGNRLKFLELNGEPEAKRNDLRRVFEKGGIRAGWQWTLDDMKQREAREFVCPFEEALLEARLGDREAAFASLQKSYAIGDGNLVWIKVMPALDLLRSDPRFVRLMELLHLAT